MFDAKVLHASTQRLLHKALSPVQSLKEANKWGCFLYVNEMDAYKLSQRQYTWKVKSTVKPHACSRQIGKQHKVSQKQQRIGERRD